MIHQLHQAQLHQKTQVIYFRISFQLLCAFLCLRNTPALSAAGLSLGGGRVWLSEGRPAGHHCFSRGRIALRGPGTLKGSPIFKKQSGSPVIPSWSVCFLEGPVGNFCLSLSLTLTSYISLFCLLLTCYIAYLSITLA